VTPLVVLGDFAWDVLIRTGSPLLAGGDTFGEVLLLPGGSAANVAVWAQRAGLAATFVGKVGRDRLGALAREDLAGEGVRAILVATEERPTGSVAVFVDHTGERSMVSGQGADFLLRPDDLPQGALQGARHLHLTAWSFFTDPPRAAARAAAQVAKAAGKALSLDPASFQMIGEMGAAAFLSCTQDLGLDVFLPNREEGEALTGETEPERIAACLAALYPGALIVLKLDADGALLLEEGALTHVPPAPGRLLDATGAGDAFGGAFLARYVQGRTPVVAARFATRVAAWVIERPGARPPPDAALAAVLAEV
jgi:ribokinase